MHTQNRNIIICTGLRIRRTGINIPVLHFQDYACAEQQYYNMHRITHAQNWNIIICTGSRMCRTGINIPVLRFQDYACAEQEYYDMHRITHAQNRNIIISTGSRICRTGIFTIDAIARCSNKKTIWTDFPKKFCLFRSPRGCSWLSEKVRRVCWD
jgi:hypothetical protein